ERTYREVTPEYAARKLNEIGASFPQGAPIHALNPLDVRDAWMYEQRVKHRKSYKQIQSELGKHLDYEQIDSLQGTQQAIERFAERKGIPSPVCKRRTARGIPSPARKRRTAN